MKFMAVLQEDFDSFDRSVHPAIKLAVKAAKPLKLGLGRGGSAREDLHLRSEVIRQEASLKRAALSSPSASSMVSCPATSRAGSRVNRSVPGFMRERA